MGGQEAKDQLLRVEETQWRGWCAFVSHSKAEAQTVARSMKTYLEAALHCPGSVFLDSDSLRDLSRLCAHVRP